MAATTVNVVTTDGDAGRAGVTVSAMSSVSADTQRPTLLVCINENSSAAAAILENGVFCVNILRDDQSYISDTFAGRYKDRIADKFECCDWRTGELGVPRVADALAAFDCRIVSVSKVGTHHVCFGEVHEVTIGRNGSALVYANRAYRAAVQLDPAQLGLPEQDLVKEEKLRLGCFHTFGPILVPAILAKFQKHNPNISVEIIEGESRRLNEALLAGEIDVAIMYDPHDDPMLDKTHLVDLEPYILLAPYHRLTEKSVLHASDLEGETMIGVTDQVSGDMLEGILKSEGVTPRIGHRSSSFEMVRGLVGHGLGFAILMTKPATAVTYDGLPVVSRPLATKAASGRVVFAQKTGRKSDSILSFRETTLALLENENKQLSLKRL